MRKINNKMMIGMMLILGVILIGVLLSSFFQEWINGQSVITKILLATPLIIACIVSGYMMLRGSAESMAQK